MFEECKTLMELNAARIKASSDGIDLTTVNNCYNQRRQEILSAKKPYVELQPIVVKARDIQKYCGIPIAGRSKVEGCIQLTPAGFLY